MTKDSQKVNHVKQFLRITFWKRLILPYFYIYFWPKSTVLDPKLCATSCYYCGFFVWTKNKKEISPKMKEKMLCDWPGGSIKFAYNFISLLAHKYISSFPFFHLRFAGRKSNGNRKRKQSDTQTKRSTKPSLKEVQEKEKEIKSNQ